MSKPLVSIIMGSKSDLDTMQHAAEVLEELNIPYEMKIISAHRTPNLMFEYAENANQRGIKVIIAGAGGAAHLPGMTASKTILPVIGVPVKNTNRQFSARNKKSYNFIERESGFLSLFTIRLTKLWASSIITTLLSKGVILPLSENPDR